jgi:hypothetical protein
VRVCVCVGGAWYNGMRIGVRQQGAGQTARARTHAHTPERQFPTSEVMYKASPV